MLFQTSSVKPSLLKTYLFRCWDFSAFDCLLKLCHHLTLWSIDLERQNVRICGNVVSDKQRQASLKLHATLHHQQQPKSGVRGILARSRWVR